MPTASPVPAPSPPASRKASAPPARPRIRPLEFHGLLNLQADSGELGSSRRKKPRPIYGGLGIYDSPDSLEIRQLTTILSGGLGPGVTGQVSSIYLGRSGAIRLLDAFLAVKTSPSTDLLVGQFKTRFGYEGWLSTAAVETIERSDVTRALYPGRQVGLNLQARSGVATFNLGVLDGERNAVSSLQPRMVQAKVTLEPLPVLHVGVSTVQGTMVTSHLQPGLAGTPPLAKFPVQSYGLEVVYNEAPWKVEAEMLAGSGYNLYAQEAAPSMGGYVRVVRRLSPDFDVLFNADYFDPDTQWVDEFEADNHSNARCRFVVGVNYYVDRAALHRFMFNYEFRQTTEGPRLDTSGWRLRYQFRW